MPAAVCPQPKVALIVDTSGSMREKDLGKALGVVAQGLASLPPENLLVVSGDTCAQSVQKVFKAQDVSLKGGGGTDMGAIMEEIAKTKKPDAMIVVTDGYTGYPSQQLRARTVVCLTGRAPDSYPVPAWCMKVELKDE